jgi:hypothetical protein
MNDKDQDAVIEFVKARHPVKAVRTLPGYAILRSRQKMKLLSPSKQTRRSALGKWPLLPQRTRKKANTANRMLRVLPMTVTNFHASPPMLDVAKCRT